MENRARGIVRPEYLGGIVGLVVAAGVSGFRVVNASFDSSSPFNSLRFSEELFGNIVLTLILATPYIAALFSTRFPIGTRWVILLPSAIVAVPALVISFSLIGFLFLPSIILLFIAVGRSLDRNPISGASNALALVIAAAVIITVFAAAVSLFRNHNDARGWVYRTFPDGHTEWQSVPQTPGHLGSGVIHAPDGGRSGFNATSDIITNPEAAAAGGLLLLAWIEMGTIGIYAARRFPDGHPVVP